MQRYNIKFYNPKWEPLARIYQPNIFNITYKEVLNDAGSCQFQILASHPTVNQEVLQKANKIELLFGDEVIWNGFINTTNFGDDIHEVDSVGLLGLMGTINMQNTKSYNDLNSNIARDIFANFLAEYSTGIEYGEIKIYNPQKVEEKFEYDKYLDALDRIRKTCNAEMKIGIDRKLYMYNNIGSDKSDFITLRYNQKFPSVSNIKNTFKIIDDFSEYANLIIGKSNVTTNYDVSILGETYTLTKKENRTHIEKDLTEIEKYGVVTEFIDYGDELDEIGLIEKTKSDLASRVNNVRIDNIEILKDRVSFKDIAIGDKIRVDVKNEYYNISQIYKIISISNAITDSAENLLKVGVVLEDRKLPPLTFEEFLASLNKRLNFIEKRL